jgi:antitoxin (DNA-binding transcriptional repressor) of toxin-antitoxin stability system
MESRVVHVDEADPVPDLAAILRRVQAGTEVVIERDAQPLAVIRAAAPPRRTICESIALAFVEELIRDVPVHPSPSRWRA